MWLSIRPPDSPFEKVFYYYDYKIRDAEDSEKPEYYKRDVNLSQKCFIITFRVKIQIDINNRIKIKFNGKNILSDWNKSHSKEIKSIGPKVRKQIITKIFNQGDK